MDWYVCGSQARTVIDDEAANILLDYIDRYYYDDYLSVSEFFGKAFSEAARHIMSITKSPWVTVAVVLGVTAILAILFFWWMHARKHKNLKDQQMEDILNMPLEKFSDLEAEELAKKYEGSDKSV